MRAYKVTDSNMQCHGYQYVLGHNHQHDEELEIGESGFHAYRNPMDAMMQRDLSVLYESRFFVVDCCGDIIEEEDVSACSTMVCSEIKFVSEMTLKEWIALCCQYKSCDGRKDKSLHGDTVANESSDYCSSQASHVNANMQVSSGDYAKQSSSGHFTRQSATGSSCSQASAGSHNTQTSQGHHGSQASSGDFNILLSSGDFSMQASCGEHSEHMSSGDFIMQSSVGDASMHELCGENSVASALGNLSRVKLDEYNSWLVLADHDKNGVVKRIIANKPGDEVDGVTIKTKHWYWFEDGKLMEEKG